VGASVDAGTVERRTQRRNLGHGGADVGGKNGVALIEEVAM